MNTLLVVEDDSAVRRLLTVALSADAHSRVLSFNDAESALEELRNEIPDLILCDVQLPGMNGTEFAQIVRSTPLLADTPVILMSAYEEPNNHAADSFISNPSTPSK